MEKKINQIDAQGFRQGPWESYHHDGNLWSKGSFLDGKRTGYWEYYWFNGNFMWKGSYLNGIEIGTWEQYDIEGNLKKVIYYH